MTWNIAPSGFSSTPTDTKIVSLGDNFWTVTEDVFDSEETDRLYSVVVTLTNETQRKDSYFSSKETADINLWPYLHIETQAPILIRTAEDLNDIGKDPNNWDKYYLLVNDINMADYTGTEFNVIGYWQGMFSPNNVPFTGIFDGNNHAISNFTYQCANGAGIGLFGHIDGPNALIRDLTLIDPNIEAGNCNTVGALAGSLGRCTVSHCRVVGGNVAGDQSVGGLIGVNDNGYITDCATDLNVSATYYVGNLVGYNWRTITNCITGGTVSGGSYAGGLVGHSDGAIHNSHSSANVSGSVYVGGLVGFTGAPISHCSATGSVTGVAVVGGLAGEQLPFGDIEYSYAMASVQADRQVGGLVGRQLFAGIDQCYAYSTVNGTEDVGGLAGDIMDGHITNSYAAGAVEGDSNVGGLVGLARYDSRIDHSYASGPVTGISNTGGFLGKSYGNPLSYPSFESCFWDTEVNPALDGIGNKTDPDVIAKPTAQMQTKSTFTAAGWNFTNTWDICEGTNYPRLVWSIPELDFVCPDGVSGEDFSYFASWWGEENCGESNDCDGVDFDFSGVVDWGDLKVFCGRWLEGK